MKFFVNKNSFALLLCVLLTHSIKAASDDDRDAATKLAELKKTLLGDDLPILEELLEFEVENAMNYSDLYKAVVKELKIAVIAKDKLEVLEQLLATEIAQDVVKNHYTYGSVDDQKSLLCVAAEKGQREIVSEVLKYVDDPIDIANIIEGYEILEREGLVLNEEITRLLFDKMMILKAQARDRQMQGCSRPVTTVPLLVTTFPLLDDGSEDGLEDDDEFREIIRKIGDSEDAENGDF